MEVSDRESRLDGAVADYLHEADMGRPLGRAEFLARYPELAADLAEFLDDRDRIARVIGPPAAGPRPPLPRQCPHCHRRLAAGGSSAACPGCGVRVPLDPGSCPTAGPARLGRFEVTAVAGRGAFGTVYRAWDPSAGREVAVKVPRDGARARAEDIDRFFREAQFAARLHHPGVVRVYETGQVDGVPYLVCEFVAGETLAAVVRDRRPAVRWAAGVVVAVADALDYAHRQGVIHRDVKPSNILLRRDGAPVVADFGLARLDGVETTLTAAGDILGTPAYMSPEQARGESARVDARSDVYSLGVVLYHLLTGRPPFAGSPRVLIHQLIHDEPLPPRAADALVPRDLETICLKCLRKDPARRYRTAAALADDLRRFLAARVVLARPAGRAERLSQWARRNPGLAAAGGLVAALLVAVAAVSAGWAVHADRQAGALRQALDESRRVTAGGRLDRGLADADRGDPGAGLLAMAWGLEALPDGASDLDWAARANLAAWRSETPSLANCWDAPPGSPLGFTPDGAGVWVAAGGVARRWDLAAGRFDGPGLEHPAAVAALAVSPDGRRVATVCGGRHPARVWDAATGEPGPRIDTGGEVCRVAFLPDGRVLTASRTGRGGTPPATALRTWDSATGRPAGPEVRMAGWVDELAVGPSGPTVYTACRADRLIRRTELPGGRSAAVPFRHPDAVTALAVSPDGRHLLTAGPDGTARLFDATTDRVVAVVRHRAAVSAAAFRPDGQGFQTAAPGDGVRAWEMPARPPAAERHPGNVRAVAVGPDGRVATGADDRSVRVFEVAAGRLNPVAAVAPFPSPVASVAFSPDGRTLATATHQHPGAFLDDLPTGQRILLPHPNRVHRVAFSPDGGRLVTVGYDTGVRVWDRTGAPAAGPLPHDGIVLAAAFSPDGQLLATGCEDGSARLWDPASWSARGDPLWHSTGAAVWVVTVSPDGQTVLTAGDDGAARFWDARTGQPVGPVLKHGQPIAVAAFGPDGRTVLTGGRDGVARLWDWPGGRAVGPPLRHDGPVRAAAVAPSGRWAVTAAEDGTARVWEVAGGRPVGPPRQHEAPVQAAVIDPAGRWAVTAGLDRTARVWPAPDPPAGPPARLTLWAQVVVGSELDEAGGVRALDPNEWRDRRRRLRVEGGSP